jgi:hypothetical protein
MVILTEFNPQEAEAKLEEAMAVELGQPPEVIPVLPQAEEGTREAHRRVARIPAVATTNLPEEFPDQEITMPA